MDWNRPGSSVLHKLPEFVQIHVHWVGNYIFHLILGGPLILSPSTFPDSQSSPMNCLIASGGQSIGASSSVLVLSMNIQLISYRIDSFALLAIQGLSRVFSSPTIWKLQFFGSSVFIMVQLSHLHMTTGKTVVLIIWTFVGQVMLLLSKLCLRSCLKEREKKFRDTLVIYELTFVTNLE